MNKSDISATLQALARGDNKPQVARLRDVFDDIDAALAAGVRRADVLAALHEHGFTMSLRTFDSALYRIRKERAAGKGRVPLQGARSSPSGAADSTPPHVAESKSNEGHLTNRQRRERKAQSYIDQPKPRFIP